MKLFLLLLFFALFNSQAGEAQVANKRINEAWKNVTTQLQRKTDLFYSIAKEFPKSDKIDQSQVNLVTKFTAELSSLIDSVKTPDSSSVSYVYSLLTNLNGAFNRCLVSLEQDLKLKNSSPLKDLQIHLMGIENRIFVAQNKYNQMCTEANRPELYFGKPSGAD